MSINCTVSHNDPIKSLGTWTAEDLLILSQCQCDEGECHMTVTSPALGLCDVAHQRHSLTHLMHTTCASRCPRTPTRMGFYFPSARLMGLTVQGGMMANFCIRALPHLSRNVLRISDFLESPRSCSTLGSTGQWC